ncbi:hypothetical protein Trydic_g20254 [Trypoxylus dichotomus]
MLKLQPVVPSRKIPPLKCYNFTKADWHKFGVNRYRDIMQVAPTISNCDLVCKMVKRITSRNVPRGGRTPYIPGIKEETKVLYDKYLEHYK